MSRAERLEKVGAQRSLQGIRAAIVVTFQEWEEGGENFLGQ